MRVHRAAGSPRLLPTLGPVPVGEQSEIWGESSGGIRRRRKPPGSLVVHAPPHSSGGDRSAWAILSGLVGLWGPPSAPRVLPAGTKHGDMFLCGLVSAPT